MPEKITVQAKIPEKKENGKVVSKQVGPFSITVDTGKTAKEMIEMFGDEAVKTNAQANWVVTLQSNMRSGMKKGETQEQLQARLATAKMGVSQKGVTVDPKQAYLAEFASATPERQAEMIKELQEKAAKVK